MRLQCRRSLSYFLLATFASISLLGEGLHVLTLEVEHHHHHHRGLCVVTHARHDLRIDDQKVDFGVDARLFANGAERGATSADAVLTADDGEDDSHVCKICAFLAQVLSQPVEFAAPLDWKPFVAAAQSRQQLTCTTTSLGPQAPRGPPLLA
jgi:hypothetical protein